MLTKLRLLSEGALALGLLTKPSVLASNLRFAKLAPVKKLKIL